MTRPHRAASSTVNVNLYSRGNSTIYDLAAENRHHKALLSSKTVALFGLIMVRTAILPFTS